MRVATAVPATSAATATAVRCVDSQARSGAVAHAIETADHVTSAAPAATPHRAGSGHPRSRPHHSAATAIAGHTITASVSPPAPRSGGSLPRSIPPPQIAIADHAARATTPSPMPTPVS